MRRPMAMSQWSQLPLPMIKNNIVGPFTHIWPTLTNNINFMYLHAFEKAILGPFHAYI